MAKYSTLTALFSAIANSLRAKTGTSGTIIADDFPSVIDGISTGVEGGIIPTGTKTITTNGTHDVKVYESAEVNVPIPSGYIKPSGNKSITTNGTHDVTNFASATVNVPTGITPTGTKEIITNGTHDVTNYASVDVNIEMPNVKIYCKTLTSDLTSGWYTLVSNDAFLASLYNDPNAFILMYGKNTAKASTAMKDLWFCAGFTIGYAGTTARNNILMRQSTSAIAVVAGSGISADNYNGNLKLDSTGTLKTYGKTDYVMAAGEYVIIAGSV